MSPVDLGLLTIAAALWVAVGVTFVVAKQFHRDQVFTGVVPGTIPRDPQSAPRERVKGTGQEYHGEIAVAFAPPKGLRPGLIGTVVDGTVDSRDITATLVDLAIRGHLTIEAIDGAGEPNEAMKQYARRQVESKKTDWLLKRTTSPTADVLLPAESKLLDGLFHGLDRMRMGNLDRPALQALREAQVDLYRDVVARGWYPRHPAQRGVAGCAIVAVGLLVGALFVATSHTVAGIGAAVAVVAASIALTRALRGRTPRTALGSAVRIQALGFKKYLATAEAEQFKFEEAAGIFSRYLPYAMVFGVAQHWAKVFGQVVANGHAAGLDVPGSGFDLLWFDGPNVDFGDLLFWDSLDGDLDFFGAGEAMIDVGSAAVDGFSEFAGNVGEFMGSLDFLDAVGNGCGDIGCGDLGGCIDF